MKITDYIRILRRRGWIILLAIVVTAVSAFAFSLLQTPVYRSSVEVVIELARPDLGLAQTAKQLLSSYANYMHSERQADEVIEVLGLIEQSSELIGDVTIASDDLLMVIRIDVDRPDGDEANDIANTWAQLLVKWRDERNANQDQEDRVYAEVIDPATYRLLRPKKGINTVAGAFFGLVIGVMIVIALEWLQAGVLYDPRMIESETGLNVIGVIPGQSGSKKKGA